MRHPVTPIAAALAAFVAAGAGASDAADGTACRAVDAAGLCVSTGKAVMLPGRADRDLTDAGAVDFSVDPALPDILPPAPTVGDRVEETRYTVIDRPEAWGLPSLPATERWVAVSEEVVRISAEDGFVLEVFGD